MNTRNLTALVMTISFVLMSFVAAFAVPIFEENFEGTVGDDLSTLGWTFETGYTGLIKISDSTIDSGNSVTSDYDTNTMYKKYLPFNYILADGEVVRLTGVTYTPVGAAGNGTGTSIGLICNGKAWELWNWNGLYYWYAGTQNGTMPVPAADQAYVLDFKIEFSKTASSFYYRRHGTTTWNLIQSTTAGVEAVQYVRIDLWHNQNMATYPAIDTVKLESVISSIAGNVTLEDYDGDVTKVSVTAQLMQGGSAIGEPKMLQLDAAGNYTIPSIMPGTYDVVFDAACWLQKTAQNVVVPDDAPGTANVTLNSGTIDGDDEVTTTDLSIVLKNMGKTGAP